MKKVSLNDKEWASFANIGSDDGVTSSDSDNFAVKSLQFSATVKTGVAAETVAIAAGAAGTTGVTSVSYAPIVDSSGTRLGDAGDTSFAFVTGTCLTTEVAWDYNKTDAAQLALLTNGQFAIDYNSGKIRYKKATTATSDTANYSTRLQKVDTELELDATGITIENLKVFSTDGTAANSKFALVDASNHVQVDVLSSTGIDGVYVDDGTGFAVATSKGYAMMGLATSDVVDAGDIGAVRMTLNRNVGMDLTEQSLTAVKVSATSAANLVTNPIFVACGDGATTAVVETAGTKKALNVNLTDGTNDMPTGDAVARSIYTAVGDGTNTAVVETAGTKKALNVNITDGTNDMPTMDAISRRGFVGITDGTNSMPTMDAIARRGFVGITDGTNSLPMMDANSRAGFMQLTNGTLEATFTQSSGAGDAGNKLGVASEVVDFDTSAGTDFTGAMGVLAASALGAKPLTVDASNNLNVNVASGTVTADLDGEYDVSTNPNPDSVGLLVHQNVIAGSLDETVQNVRTTGGVSVAVVASNTFFGMDTRAKLYAKDGTDDREIITDNAGHLQVDVLSDPALAYGTDSVTAHQGGSWSATVSATDLDIRSLAYASDSVTAHQGGAWNITNISGTISLPTGAATETTVASVKTAVELIDDTVKQGLGAKALMTTPVITPAAHTTETISEDNHAFDVNCAVADKVYSLGVAAGVIDGTNNYAVMELNVSVPSGTANPEAVIVKVYREDTADGNDPVTTAICERAMIGEARVYIPLKPAWATTAVKITCSSAVHIYGDVQGVYYTPA